ncbi:MAG: hypothetical protein ACOCWU_02925, partial [Spirochaetota bacterium]
LSVYEDTRLVLRLSGGWLYPLFVLKTAQDTAGEPLFAGDCVVRCEDPKIGQGAVFLYATLGIRRAHGELASRLAQQKAQAFGIALTADTWTDSLQCGTEAILEDVVEVAEGVALLESRLVSHFRDKPGDYVCWEYLDGRKPSQAVAALLETPCPSPATQR